VDSKCGGLVDFCLGSRISWCEIGRLSLWQNVLFCSRLCTVEVSIDFKHLISSRACALTAFKPKTSCIDITNRSFLMIGAESGWFMQDGWGDQLVYGGQMESRSLLCIPHNVLLISIYETVLAYH
jgi:hypothetical protein